MLSCRAADLVGAAAVGLLLVDEHGRSSRPEPPWRGFQSVHAFPLRVRRQVIGAMNVFGDTEGGDFTGTDVPVVQALADVAAIGCGRDGRFAAVRS